MIAEKRVKLVFVIFCGLLAASCFHHKLPDDWPLPESLSGTSCPDISGSYHRDGDCADGDKAPSLTEALLKKDIWKEATHVVIEQQNEESISVTIFKNTDVLSSKTLSLKSGDFTCEAGWLKITRLGGGVIHTNALGLGASTATYSFSTSKGNLLGKFVIVGIGVSMLPLPLLLPVSVSTWCRYYPIHNEAQGSDAEKEGRKQEVAQPPNGADR